MVDSEEYSQYNLKPICATLMGWGVVNFLNLYGCYVQNKDEIKRFDKRIFPQMPNPIRFDGVCLSVKLIDN